MTTAPIFKITDLHIRGLRGLQKLDLPQDGMGWENGFPPVSVIGGANGSGKTTLLRCIAQAVNAMAEEPTELPSDLNAEECRLDFQISDGSHLPVPLRFYVCDNAVAERHRTRDCYGYERFPDRVQPYLTKREGRLWQAMSSSQRFAASSLPRLIYFPSDERDLVVPQVQYKAPGKLDDSSEFVTWWRRSASQQWSGSLLELFFSARWADLNAKDHGKPQDATNFDRYTRAFTDLTLGEKRLVWTLQGDLLVELRDGTQHPVQELSSGERQALLLLAELRRFWRPGSLVLIDELELHLHDAWQGKLYDVIKAMQAELGGQVIITTQSHSLFEMADLGTRALLGRGGLR